MIKINEVYFVDLSPAIGKEFAGIRKCKIDKIYNEDLIRVIPFSMLDNKYHTEQARTIDVKRLREKVKGNKNK